MKRLAVFMVVLAMLVPVACAAAEAAVTAKNWAWGIDWTQVLVAVIGVVSTLAGVAWKRYVRPWLEQKGLMDVEKGLMEAASVVVNAVEAMHGKYCADKNFWLCGEDKWKLALDKMNERGFNVNSGTVIDALKAAWQQLNLEQIAAGVKAPSVETGNDAQ